MMERLTEYGRPLFDRPTRTLALSSLSLSDIATITQLAPEDVIDTYAITGGLPAFALARRRSDSLETFLRSSLESADAPFVATAARVLDAEFPPRLEARRVLSAIGHGGRTRQMISDAVGVKVGNLTASLGLLSDAKRVVQVTRPYATKSLNAPLYSIVDPYLRFWLRFVERELSAIERQRTEDVVARIMGQWPSARGRMVEPIIRAALERRLPDERLPGATYIGSYWNRKGISRWISSLVTGSMILVRSPSSVRSSGENASASMQRTRETSSRSPRAFRVSGPRPFSSPCRGVVSIDPRGRSTFVSLPRISSRKALRRMG